MVTGPGNDFGQSVWVIVVVEGPSAAGKTTWAADAAPREQVVQEHGRVEVPTDVTGNEAAAFWADVNAQRWTRALAVEAVYGLAICDGDPLKLHFDYCLARIGQLPWTRFRAGVEACGTAIEDRRLGIADAIFCSIPDVGTLDARRKSDTTRRRTNHALHRQLGPALQDWYSTLNELDPGRVDWTFPSDVAKIAPRSRYDLDLFAAWMTGLPGSR